MKITDWKIVLEPFGDIGGESGGCLEILRGEELDALDALDGWAEAISQRGAVPRSMDWQNESPAAVVSKAGKRAYRVRVDCFERKTETGWTSGAGWLRAKEIYE